MREPQKSVLLRWLGETKQIKIERTYFCTSTVVCTVGTPIGSGGVMLLVVYVQNLKSMVMFMSFIKIQPLETYIAQALNQSVYLIVSLLVSNCFASSSHTTFSLHYTNSQERRILTQLLAPTSSKINIAMTILYFESHEIIEAIVNSFALM